MEGSGSKPVTRRWWQHPSIAHFVLSPPSCANAARDAAHGHDAEAGAEAMLDLDDPAQRELGDHELLELIGRGGMGVVYRARQRVLDREVAIKLLSPVHRATARLIDLFRREAQNAALLQHPNIVVIHEMGEHRGLVYYAMQLVRGRSLSQRLEDGPPLAPREAASLLRTIAEAVDHAHRLGVLHLDLKPGNVLVDGEGVPHVADFGLARRLEQALDEGITGGTPGYMAPEQAEGRSPLTPATDIWALGAMLYELLAGRPPLGERDPPRAGPPPLQGEAGVRLPSTPRSVPPDLEAICLACLREQPQQRYRSARALADDLGRFLEGRPVGVRPLNAAQRLRQWARREPRLAIAGGVAIAALLAGTAATGLQWRRAEGNALAASERLWESRREAALADERAGDPWGALSLLLRNVDEQERGSTPGVAALDRKRIGMLVQQGSTLVDTIAITDANPLAVALSADGSRLAIATSEQGVRWYDTATLTERGRISLGGRASGDGAPRSITLLRFVGNDRVLATMEWYSNMVSPNPGDTWLLDLARGAVVEPPAAFKDFSDASYSANGEWAMLRNRDWQVQRWQVRPWKPLSPLLGQRGARVRPEPWLLESTGRHAFMLNPGMRKLGTSATARMQLQDRRLPGDAGISAWQASHDGRLLALGDFEGRVFLLDAEDGALDALSGLRGGEVTWLAFSEDDRWLAVAGNDGSVRAFDVATRESLVSGAMEHDFAVRRVGISRERRMLVAAGEGRAGAWRLPDGRGPRAGVAIRIGGPAAHGQAAPYAIDWSLHSGLLATAGIDGQVRLWRLPPNPTPAAATPPQVADRLQFDGRFLADVEWNRLRLLRADGAPATPWKPFAQPPGFAELSADGRTLAVTVGPSLQLLDVPSLAPRAAPVPLPDSPQRMLLSHDGQRVLLGFGSRTDAGFADRLLQFDTASGRRLPGEAMLPGPLARLAYADDDRRLLAVGPPDAAVTILRGQDLRVLDEQPQDPFQPVIDAVFSVDGHDILMLARAPDPRLGVDALLVWDLRAGRIRARHPTGRMRPLGLVAVRTGAFVAGEANNAVYDARADLDPVPRRRGASAALRLVPAIADAGSGGGSLALSPDGRYVAQASRRAVQLLSARDGRRVGAPLWIDSHAMDAITQMAFSPDGESLLARTLERWTRWPVAPVRGGTQSLAARLSRLDAAAEDPLRVPVPSLRERSALRAADRGPWLASETRQAPPPAGHGWKDGSPIPARTTADATLLDLTAHYGVGPASVRDNYYNIRPHLRPYPAGVQRFGGIRFDVRGMRDVGGDESRTLDCVPIPAPGMVSAIHALILPALQVPAAPERAMGEFVFHYRDGGNATAPLRAARELPGYGGDDHGVPLAYAPRFARLAVDARGEVLAAPRLANPRPDRTVRCVGLRATAEPMLLLAMTVEPAAPPASPSTVHVQRREVAP